MRFFITPSPAESLIDLRGVLHPKVESAKALAFDLQQRQRGAKTSGRWVSGFASLADELSRWSNTLKEERKRLRSLKGKTRDSIQRAPKIASWWKKNAKSVRAKLRSAEAAIALQQLTVGLASTVRGRQNDARRSADIEWIQIPEGSLWVSDTQNPSQSMEIQFKRPFFVSKTEVTVAQYQRCVNAGACTPPSWNDCLLWSGGRYHSGEAPKSFRQPRRPVVCVSWSQARGFARWIGGDLPSESEWMYIAQSAGQGTSFPWGNQPANCDYAVMNVQGRAGCGEQRTWDVCSKPSGESEQGACDLAGNVWEWVLDEGPASGGAQFPLEGGPRCANETCESPQSSHIARGGGWGSGRRFLTTTARVDFGGERIHLFLGFRPIMHTQ